MTENPNDPQNVSIDQKVSIEQMQLKNRIIEEASVSLDKFLLDLNDLEHSENRIVLIKAICGFFEVILDQIEGSRYTILDVINTETRMAEITELILITENYDLFMKTGRTIYSTLNRIPRTEILDLLIPFTLTFMKLIRDLDNLDNNFKVNLRELYKEFYSIMFAQLLPQIKSPVYGQQFGVQLRRALYFNGQLLDWLEKS